MILQSYQTRLRRMEVSIGHLNGKRASIHRHFIVLQELIYHASL